MDEALAVRPDRDPDVRARLARHLAAIGVLQSSTKDKKAVLANYREALAIFNELTDRRPEVSATAGACDRAPESGSSSE